jgi:hypothetical protein
MLSTQDFGFTEEQSRTLAEEQVKVREGFSHTLHSHHIIDCEPGWAAPGCSGALDAAPYVEGRGFVWEWPLIYPVAAAFKAASLQLGIDVTWGGCWGRLMREIPGDDAAAMKAAQTGFDGPHFELGRN